MIGNKLNMNMTSMEPILDHRTRTLFREELLLRVLLGTMRGALGIISKLSIM